MDESDATANLSPTLQRIQVYSGWLDAILIRTGYLSGALFALTAFFITYDVLARKWGHALGIPSTRVTDGNQWVYTGHGRHLGHGLHPQNGGACSHRRPVAVHGT